MSIATELVRIQNARNVIRNKLNTIGLVGTTANLDDCASAINEITNRGAVSGTIIEKGEAYTIPQGYHDGSGTVTISETEQTKIIPNNIREGITLLGVTGTMSGSEASKPQSKTVVPGTTEQTILPDENYNCLSQVTVRAIPYVESENSAGGITVTIG